MQEEKDVVVDTLNGTTESLDVKSDSETAEQRLARLEETNKKLYERAKIAEAKAKELKQLQTTEKPKVDDDSIQKVNRLDEIEKKRQFGYKNRLSPEETDLLFRISGDKDPNETMKDEDFKELLEIRRRKERVSNAIPSSSNRTREIEGKSFKEMSSSERAANWSKIVNKG